MMEDLGRWIVSHTWCWCFGHDWERVDEDFLKRETRCVCGMCGEEKTFDCIFVGEPYEP